MNLIVFTDGASRGNPGQASYGFTISDDSGQLIYEEGRYIGVTTNNVAEYSAVLEALKYIKNNLPQVSQIHFFMDSRLVVEQLSGRFKVKSPHLLKIIEQIRSVMKDYPDVKFTHVYRDKNKIADKLANLALDKL